MIVHQPWVGFADLQPPGRVQSAQSSMNGDDHNRKVLCDIARCAFDVVNRLLSRDQSLASELRSSETSSRQIYREECITVEMAATLRERFPKHVEITLFTPPEEKRNGADWYWRFERGDRAIHARVQAKRVQRDEYGQRDEHGHLDIDVAQLTQLLESTENATKHLPGLNAWLATYARFRATPPCGEDELRHCRLHRHEELCLPHEPSLWIAKAEEIKAIGVRRARVNQIIENSVRLDCMLACIDDELAADDGPASKGFVLRDDLLTYQECLAAIESNALLRSAVEGALRITA